MPYPILSDPSKDVARAYGVLAPSGYASRWTFFIGADGRILDIDKKVSAASHARDIVAQLTQLPSSPHPGARGPDGGPSPGPQAGRKRPQLLPDMGPSRPR